MGTPEIALDLWVVGLECVGGKIKILVSRSKCWFFRYSYYINQKGALELINT